MAQQIQLRNGTATQWTSANPTLAVGELGVETDTNKFKVGTGSTAWNSLGYSLGFTWRGAWSSATAYAVNDLVTYGNASYISIQAGTNQTPGVANSYWTVVVSGSGLDIGGTNTQVQYNNAGLLGGSANLTFNGTTLTTAGLALKGSTSGTVTITAPATAGTQSYTLPTALPSANDQALTATTSGTLSWSTVSSPAATPTVLGTVYGSMNSGSPYLTAVGYQAGNSNTGAENTAAGYQALYNNTSGTPNTAFGYKALYTATTAYGNSAFGHYALLNCTGSANTALGRGSLLTNTTGANNTVVGYYAGALNTTGSDNVVLGRQALYSNTNANYNVAVGSFALNANTTGQNNTAIGYQAMYSNTGNYQSTAVGFQALYNSNASLSSASYNDAFGCQALYSCTTGVGNVAMGSFGYAGSSSALWSCTTGSNNTALGQGALRALTTGSGHTAVGTSALWNATTGDSNVCIGGSAGYALTEGSRNVFIGNGTGQGGFGISGPITTGSYNIMIGMTACGSSPSVSNEMVIASTYSVQGKGGSTGFICANYGNVYQGNNSSTWAQTSDRRLKKNIVDNNIGLEKINAIRVRNFEYRLPEEVESELKPADAIKKSGVQLGVIAQELQEVLPDCVKQETTGVMSVDPDNLTWYTINAIKELSLEVQNLKSQIEELKRG
jgi:hypothetical protein